MKMSLTIIAPTVEEIKRVMKLLAQERLESNCSGDEGMASFNYDFVDSNDLFSEDGHLPTINPEKE